MDTSGPGPALHSGEETLPWLPNDKTCPSRKSRSRHGNTSSTSAAVRNEIPSRSSRSRLPARDTRRTALARTKAILWIVGIVVALLFLAALWRVSRAPPHPAAGRDRPSPCREPRCSDRPEFVRPDSPAMCGLATVPTFRYCMALKTMLNNILFKGSTDDDLLPDRSLRPGSQHESVADAIIGGPGPGRLSESR